MSSSSVLPPFDDNTADELLPISALPLASEECDIISAVSLLDGLTHQQLSELIDVGCVQTESDRPDIRRYGLHIRSDHPFRITIDPRAHGDDRLVRVFDGISAAIPDAAWQCAHDDDRRESVPSTTQRPVVPAKRALVTAGGLASIFRPRKLPRSRIDVEPQTQTPERFLRRRQSEYPNASATRPLRLQDFANEIRRRTFTVAYRPPPPSVPTAETTMRHPMHIVYWMDVSRYTKHNAALKLAIQAAHTLNMPILAVLIDKDDAVTADETIRQGLADCGIPLLYCRPSSADAVAELLVRWCTVCHCHLLITDDSTFTAHSESKQTVANAVKCNVLAVDNESLQPTRYVGSNITTEQELRNVLLESLQISDVRSHQPQRLRAVLDALSSSETLPTAEVQAPLYVATDKPTDDTMTAKTLAVTAPLYLPMFLRHYAAQTNVTNSLLAHDDAYQVAINQWRADLLHALAEFDSNSAIASMRVATTEFASFCRVRDGAARILYFRRSPLQALHDVYTHISDVAKQMTLVSAALSAFLSLIWTDAINIIALDDECERWTRNLKQRAATQ